MKAGRAPMPGGPAALRLHSGQAWEPPLLWAFPRFIEKILGLYYVDVWIEDGKMLLEIKVALAIEPIHAIADEVLTYLLNILGHPCLD